jgi:hypothetical protein
MLSDTFVAFAVAHVRCTLTVEPSAGQLTGVGLALNCRICGDAAVVVDVVVLVDVDVLVDVEVLVLALELVEVSSFLPPPPDAAATSPPMSRPITSTPPPMNHRRRRSPSS